MANRPLRHLTLDHLLLVHRHWMWANLQRETFRRLLSQPDAAAWLTDMNLAHPVAASMMLWYALLYAVVEALRSKKIVLEGVLADDVQRVRGRLKEFRNAVLHISWSRYWDQRIAKVLTDQAFPDFIHRISGGVGRLLHEEFDARDRDGVGQQQ